MKKSSTATRNAALLGAACLLAGLQGCMATAANGDDDTQLPAVGGSAGTVAGTGGSDASGTSGTGPGAGTGAEPGSGAGGGGAGTPTGGTGGVGASGGTADPGAGTAGAPPPAGAGGTDPGAGGVAGAGGTDVGAGAGGTAGDGGTGVGAGGTAGSAAGAGGVNSDPLCKGIKSNMACTSEGLSCPVLACGLADSGRRDCACATNWTCTSCDFTGSPYATAPASPATCTTEKDKDPCTTEGAVCIGAPNSEVCACYMDGSTLIWDCDKQPWP